MKIEKMLVTSKLNFSSEILALSFGMLLILIDFGDSHLAGNIGNLDTIFGLAYWQVFDAMLPLVSVLVFLLYGKSKGGLKFNKLAIASFISFLIVLCLIALDDIALVLGISIHLTRTYWIIVEWVYPLWSLISFFLFGKASKVKDSLPAGSTDQ